MNIDPSFINIESGWYYHRRLQIYRIIAPTGCVCIAGITWYDFTCCPIGINNLVIRAFIFSVYFALTVLIWASDKYVKFFERTLVFMVAAAFVGFFYDGLYNLHLENNLTGLAVVFIWLPMVYLLAYLSMDTVGALRASLIFYGILIPAGAFFLYLHWKSNFVTIIINFFVANLITIFSIHKIANMMKDYVFSQAKAASYAESARMDYLTGVFNRRYVNSILDEISSKGSLLAQQPASIIMFDCDHFKNINDTHGHSAGDEVLKEVAKILAQNIRPTDTVGRWGGEEFVILVAKSLEETRQIAERIRANVESMDRFPYSLTISAGVAEMKAGESINTLLIRVDEALYRAKNNGRNRVEVAMTPA